MNLEQETVWLNQEQLSSLFERDRTSISKHIRKIFKEGELSESVVCAKFAHTTQHGAISGKKQTTSTTYYNLDVIISVGYRVKSKRGTQFRIWANKILKEYLVEGYSINQKRLEQKEQEVKFLRSGIQIMSRAIEDRADEVGYKYLKQFAKGLSLLDDYDYENLDSKGLTKRKAIYPKQEEYQSLIEQMKAEFNSDIFGFEKDSSFKSAVGQISKGFEEKDFYPSLEEKAATLLYLIVKNHAFTDGNKRIAAACFLMFLEYNNLLSNKEGYTIISNEALASLTLFIAASKAEEMETVKKLVVSILNRSKD